MKILKITIALIKELMIKNKMMIVTGLAGKMDVSQSVNEALNMIETFETEFADVSMAELVLMIVLALVMLAAHVLLSVAIVFIVITIAALFKMMKAKAIILTPHTVTGADINSRTCGGFIDHVK